MIFSEAVEVCRLATCERRRFVFAFSLSKGSTEMRTNEKHQESRAAADVRSRWMIAKRRGDTASQQSSRAVSSFRTARSRSDTSLPPAQATARPGQARLCNDHACVLSCVVRLHALEQLRSSSGRQGHRVIISQATGKDRAGEEAARRGRSGAACPGDCCVDEEGREAARGGQQGASE